MNGTNKSADIWNPKTNTVFDADSKIGIESFTAAAGQTIFSLQTYSYAVSTTSLLVFKNGELLAPKTDWVELDSKRFGLISAASSGDKIVAVAFVAVGVSAVEFPENTGYIDYTTQVASYNNTNLAAGDKVITRYYSSAHILNSGAILVYTGIKDSSKVGLGLDTSSGKFYAKDGEEFVIEGDINPLQFGAVGDGTTDDSTAIQIAINSTGGGRIIFTASHVIGTSLNIASAGLSFIGDSKYKSELIPATGFTDAIFKNHSAGIGNTGQHYWENLHFKLGDAQCTGIDFTNIANSTAFNCRFSANSVGTGVKYSAHASRLEGSYSNSCINCIFTHLSYGVVFTEGGNTNTVQGGEVISCTVGIRTQPFSGESAVDAPKILGVRIEGCGIGILEGAIYGEYAHNRFEANSTCDIDFTSASDHPQVFGGYTATSPIGIRNINLADSPLILSSDLAGYHIIEESAARPIYMKGRVIRATSGVSFPTIPSGDFAEFFASEEWSANSVWKRWLDTSNNPIYVLTLNSNNQIQIGNGSNNISLRSTTELIKSESGTGGTTTLTVTNSSTDTSNATAAKVSLKYNNSVGVRAGGVTHKESGNNNNDGILELSASDETGTEAIVARAYGYLKRFELEGDLLPSTTEVQDIGSPSKEWDNIYLQNAVTISDANRKDVLGEVTLEDAEKFLTELNPVWFSYKDSQTKAATAAYEKVIPKVERKQVEQQIVKIVDGEPVLTTEQVWEEVPVMLTAELKDSQGNVVIDPKTGKPVLHTWQDTEVISIPEQPAEFTSHTRPHTAFLAQEVKTAMKACGFVDWAGYAYSEDDDTHFLRLLEFIAFLVAGWKAHEARIANLESGE